MSLVPRLLTIGDGAGVARPTAKLLCLLLYLCGELTCGGEYQHVDARCALHAAHTLLKRKGTIGELIGIFTKITNWKKCTYTSLKQLIKKIKNYPCNLVQYFLYGTY